ncbi:unnamed protein product [Caenorhabditis auriculariae]|uniref:Uncharacterized protein n=1 Tax=Caenorhabditis auriculariae TaxID=2777116 RepID=A0A8S1GZK6_9PELO|nr:unnamed protein product [Caenorhabditis auriculariae]
MQVYLPEYDFTDLEDEIDLPEMPQKKTKKRNIFVRTYRRVVNRMLAIFAGPPPEYFEDMRTLREAEAARAAELEEQARAAEDAEAVRLTEAALAAEATRLAEVDLAAEADLAAGAAKAAAEAKTAVDEAKFEDVEDEADEAEDTHVNDYYRGVAEDIENVSSVPSDDDVFALPLPRI